MVEDWAVKMANLQQARIKYKEKLMSVEETLKERGNVHGDFECNARVSQVLKAVMQQAPNWSKLTNVQKEALEMMQHKIARLLCGNPNSMDSIRDVLGYGQLYFNAVQETEGAIDAKVTITQRLNGNWV